ncbi:hypothetical protein VULLAG_LOCUS21895 [Vulpes lagopus]
MRFKPASSAKFVSFWEAVLPLPLLEGGHLGLSLRFQAWVATASPMSHTEAAETLLRCPAGSSPRAGPGGHFHSLFISSCSFLLFLNEPTFAGKITKFYF